MRFGVVKKGIIMARIYPMFSSSKGNVSYVGSDKGILIDAGVSCRKICDALCRNKIDKKSIKGVFITHTHSDHISGLNVLMKQLDVPVFAQKTNLEIMREKNKIPFGCKVFEVDNEEIELDGFKIKSFETSHDTPANCGYEIHTPDNKKVCICTDLGIATDTVMEHLNGSNMVLLESNYDENMLKNGSYPYELKQRIMSEYGHLSNHECGEVLKKLIAGGTRHIILGHLSQENNTEKLAEKSAVEALKDYKRNRDYLLQIAPVCGGKAVVF